MVNVKINVDASSISKLCKVWNRR